jgi:response regulator RpfG family c-di-GMP phosphodiesterase
MAKRLGEILVEAGLVSVEAVESALQQQSITGHRLGDCLLELGLIQEVALLRILAAEFKTRFVSADKLAKAKIPPSVLDKVPVRMCEAECFMPLALDVENKILSIVMAEPQNAKLVREITLITEMEEVFAYVGVRSAIVAGIKKHYYGDHTAFAALEQGGVQALRDGSSGRTYESESRVGPMPGMPGSNPGQAVVLDGSGSRRDNTNVGRGTSSRANPTQLREALGAVRGTVGETDFVETLNILVGLMEMHRKEFRGHSAQVARQSILIGRRMALPPRDIAHISIAAYLHDLGKRPDKHFTLTANAKNAETKAEAKRFIRAPIKLFETVHLHGGVNAVLAQLYEAYDGSGVPQGVKGDDISAGARIIAAVDAFLDLTRNPFNPFGRPLAKAEALEHLQAESGKLYDPVVVDTIGHLQSGDLLRQRVDTDGRMVVIAVTDEEVRTDLNDAINKIGLVVHTVIKLDGVIDAVLTGEADTLVVGLSYGVQDLVNLAGFVRARPESASLPILVVGEPTDPQTKDRLANVGITAFLPMPINPDDAAGVIKGVYQDRIENGGPGHTVRGSFDELTAAELAKLLGKGRKTGRLSVRNGPQEGFVHIEKGRAVFASFGGKGGEGAVMTMLTLPQAEFSWEPETLLTDLPHADKDLEVIAREVEHARPSESA